ncbi:MAG: sulfotransferase [Flavobacteriales bacterium]
MKPLPYIEPNQWHHRFINRVTCWYIASFQKPVVPIEVPQQVHSPVWITGFFRSGTSLVTRMMNELGFDTGPAAHLLQPTGTRKMLNPDGFFENFLFMEWSLYAFHQMNAWGHLPPPPAQVQLFSFNPYERKKFIEFSVCGVHDDRISNRKKADVLRKYDYRSLINYVDDNFQKKCVLKNPHFSLLYPLLFKSWPDSTMLVCFRNPASAIASAKQVAPQLTSEIYAKYYQTLLEIPEEKITFFSYDQLVSDPEKSVRLLAQKFNANEQQLKNALACFNVELVRHQKENADVDTVARRIYEQLKSRAINK